MSADLTLVSARADRDALADRTAVLDKVGVLRTLPDDVHAMTGEVARFFEVATDTIRQLVLRNREELDSDGYTVMRPAEVSDRMSLTPSELGFPNGTSSIALYTRRAVLRIGMLLRDSEVARKVRDYLLDVEQTLPVRALPATFAAALRELANEVEARELAEARVAELEPRAEMAAKILDADGDLSVRDAAQCLTRAGIKVGQQRLFGDLARRGWISRGADGRYRVKQTAIVGGWMSVIPQSHYHPRSGLLVLDPPQPRVTPKGLQRLLAEHGADAA